MRPPPPGWPRISSTLVYRDPRAAIDWLCRVFGFELRVLVEGENGEILHSELEFGEGLVGVSGVRDDFKSPIDLGGACTQGLYVIVDDIDAHYAQVKAHGARIVRELTTADYGDRTYGAVDVEGHWWWFGQRVDQAAWDRSIAPYSRKNER